MTICQDAVLSAQRLREPNQTDLKINRAVELWVGVERVHWERVLKGKGVQKGWTFFKEEILKAQEQAVPMCCQMNRWGRRPAWLNRENLLGLRKKRRVYHLRKKEQATQKE